MGRKAESKARGSEQGAGGGAGQRPNRRLARPKARVRPKVAFRTRLLIWQARARIRFERVRTPVTFVLRVLLLASVTAGAVAGGRLLERYVRRAEAFATREVRVSGLSRLSRDEVLATAGLALGKNVFEVSPEQARARLQQSPWVAEAHVTRKLPGTYVIDVVEQQPAAVLQLEALYLVSEEGSVLKQIEPSDKVDLPVITGVDPAEFRRDLGFRSSLLVNAVALLHDYRDVGLWRREPVSEIHLEAAHGLSLYVGEQPMLVRLGERPYRKKLRRLRQILDELRGDAARPAYVYLDNTKRADRVAVRLR
jgi:cell division protein FtsQ